MAEFHLSIRKGTIPMFQHVLDKGDFINGDITGIEAQAPKGIEFNVCFSCLAYIFIDFRAVPGFQFRRIYFQE